MMVNQQKNRLFVLAIFSLSLIPFFIAWMLVDHSSLLPMGATNNGQLINPVVTTQRDDMAGLDTFSIENIGELPGHWLLANVMPNNHCNEICMEALLKTRQLRLMLNKDLSRVRRVVIVFNELNADSANQYWLKDSLLSRLRQTGKQEDEALYNRLLQENIQLDSATVTRLIGSDNQQLALRSDLIRIKPSVKLAEKITEINNGNVPQGMLLLIDPLGNLMMRYAPGFDPYKVKNDLMQLLKISQIG